VYLLSRCSGNVFCSARKKPRCCNTLHRLEWSSVRAPVRTRTVLFSDVRGFCHSVRECSGLDRGSSHDHLVPDRLQVIDLLSSGHSALRGPGAYGAASDSGRTPHSLLSSGPMCGTRYPLDQQRPRLHRVPCRAVPCALETDVDRQARRSRTPTLLRQ
jgi:hypothetical protein